MSSRLSKVSVWVWVVAFFVVATAAAWGILQFNTLVAHKLSRSKLIRIENPSMEPGIPAGSLVPYDLDAYKSASPKFGDIVVFMTPARYFESGLFVSRCVGLPGDIVEIKDRQLIRNGKVVPESYVGNVPIRDFKLVRVKGAIIPFQYGARPGYRDPVRMEHEIEDPAAIRALSQQVPVAIPSGHIVVFGDNRLHSIDSRYWGPLPLTKVVGKVQRFAL